VDCVSFLLQHFHFPTRLLGKMFSQKLLDLGYIESVTTNPFFLDSRKHGFKFTENDEHSHFTRARMDEIATQLYNSISALRIKDQNKDGKELFYGETAVTFLAQILNLNDRIVAQKFALKMLRMGIIEHYKQSENEDSTFKDDKTCYTFVTDKKGIYKYLSISIKQYLSIIEKLHQDIEQTQLNSKEVEESLQMIQKHQTELAPVIQYYSIPLEKLKEEQENQEQESTSNTENTTTEETSTEGESTNDNSDAASTTMEMEKYKQKSEFLESALYQATSQLEDANEQLEEKTRKLQKAEQRIAELENKLQSLKTDNSRNSV